MFASGVALMLLLGIAGIQAQAGTVTPATLPNWTVNQSGYSKTFSASFGTGPYTFAVTSGTLPAGLTLVSATGVLSGTPNTAGTFNFTITATDTKFPNGTDFQPYTVIINPVLSAAPTVLNGSIVGTNTNQTITITGGTQNYAITVTNVTTSGSLSAGSIMITTNNGAGPVTVSGTPNAVGNLTFDVNVTDAIGATLTQHYSLAAYQFAPAFPASVVALNPINNGNGSTQTVTGGVTPYNNLSIGNVSTGTTGLTIANFAVNANAGTVTLSGTPSNPGTFTFTLNVTDANGSSFTTNNTIAVTPHPIFFSPAPLPAGDIGTAYNQTITALGGTGAKSAAVANIVYTPNTLMSITPTASGGTVVLTGTPSGNAAGGTIDFDVSATDGSISGGAHYTLFINPALSVSGPGNTMPTVNLSYNAGNTITVSGGTPFVTNVNGVLGYNTKITAPTPGNVQGLSLNTDVNGNVAGNGSTVIISGTPTAGTYSFKLSVVDAANGMITNQLFTLFVKPNALAFTPTLPPGDVGTTYKGSVSVKTGTGTIPYTSLTVNNYNAGNTGLASPMVTFSTTTYANDTATVTFNSKPTGSGPVSFDLFLQDAAGAILDTFASNMTFTFTINPAITYSPAGGATPATPVTLFGDQGQMYNQLITAMNGTTPYVANTFTATLSHTVGNASGITIAKDSTMGTFTLTSNNPNPATETLVLSVTDAIGVTQVQYYTIQINSAPTLSPSPGALTDAEVNVTYTNKTNNIDTPIKVLNGTPPYNITIPSYNDGGTGLSAPSISGGINGTGTITFGGSKPTAAGTVNFTVKVVDAVGYMLTNQMYTINVNPALSTTPATLKPVTSNHPITPQTISLTGGNGLYSNLAVVPVSNNTGLTIAPTNSSTITISGTPTLVNSVTLYTFNVVATDSVGGSINIPYTLTINPDLSITPAALSGADVGVLYNKVLTVNGGTTPYKFITISNFSGGNTGLADPTSTGGINVNAGTITFNTIPSAAGTATFTVNVTDTAGAVSPFNYSITVSPAMTIFPNALNGAAVGVPTNQTITVSNGTQPYNISITNVVPGGTGLGASLGNNNFANLTVNTTNGIPNGTISLNGTPTGPGVFTFTVLTTDGGGGTLTKNYSLSVFKFSPFNPVTQATFSPVTALAPVNQVQTITGGTGGYAITVTSLQSGGTGLSTTNFPINTSAGTVTFNGTPTAAGTVTFNTTVTDNSGASFLLPNTITVNPPLVISPNGANPFSLNSVTVGTVSVPVVPSQPINVTGGTTPYASITVTNPSAGGTSFVGQTDFNINTTTGSVTFKNGSTSPGTFTFTVNVTDTAGATKSQNYSLLVNTSLALSPLSLPQATFGTAYETNGAKSISVQNGTTPYTTLAVSNINPSSNGLTISASSTPANSGTVTITGAPTVLGDITFKVDVFDTGGAHAFGTYTIHVNPALSFTTASPLAVGEATVDYSVQNQSIQIANGTATYKTIAVSNPSGPVGGLTFTPNLAAGTLAISGIPAAPTGAEQDVTFTVTVTDAAGAVLPKNYTIPVYAALSISPATVTGADINLPYSNVITVSGGTPKPYNTFTLLPVFAVTPSNIAGTLAAGSPNQSAGTVTISGTPSALDGSPSASGTATFSVKVIDAAGGSLLVPYTIPINPALTIAPAVLPNGDVNQVYSAQVSVANGTLGNGLPKLYVTTVTKLSNPPDTTSGGLTAAVSADGKTITFGGSSTKAGTATFRVNVQDFASGTSTPGMLTVDFPVTIVPRPTISTPNGSPGTLPTGTAGTSLDQVNAASHTITVINGARPFTTFNVTGFSAGGTNLTQNNNIIVNAVNGTVQVFSATPTAGTVSFTVNATDTAGVSLTQSYSLLINPALALSTTTLPTTDVGLAYSNSIAVSQGTTPYTITTATIGTNLTGLTVNNSSNPVTVTGPATLDGTFNFSVTVTDAAGATLATSYSSPQNYSVMVNKALSITPSTLIGATAGAPFTQSPVITVSGGTTPYTTFAVNNIVPGNTGLNSAAFTYTPAPNSTGTIGLSGTFTQGTATFDVVATDSVGGQLPGTKQHYTLVVNPPISIAPAKLNGAAVNTPTDQTITLSGGTPLDATHKYKSISVNVTSVGTTSGLGATGMITATTPTVTPTTIAPFTVDPNAGTVRLTATPLTSGGIFTFTVMATDYANAPIPVGSYQYDLSVFKFNVAGTGTPFYAPMTVGLATNQTLTITGGFTTPTFAPYTSVSTTPVSSGNTGLDQNNLAIVAGSGTVTLSGTPSGAGNLAFPVIVTDSNGATFTFNESVTVNPRPAAAPATLPNGEAGILYSQTLTRQAGTGTGANVTLTTGSVNTGTSGLTVSGSGTSTISIIGTPTNVVDTTVSFTVHSADSIGGTSNPDQTYSFTVFAKAVPFPVSTTLPTGEVGLVYGQTPVTVTSTGGTAPVNLAVSSITNTTGLSISGNGTPTITLSGTPTSLGTVSFTVTPSDAVGTNASKTYSLTILAAPLLTTSLPNGEVGVAYSNTISSAVGTGSGTVNLAVTNIINPTGITIPTSGTTITLSGPVTASGNVSFTVTPTDGLGTNAPKSYSFSIAPQALSLPSTLPNAEMGIAYNQTLTGSGGSGIVNLKISNIVTNSTGVTIGGGTGVGTPTITLSGPFTQAGMVSFDVTPVDAVGSQATAQHYSFQVFAAAMTTPSSLSNGEVAIPYSKSISSTGGNGTVNLVVSNLVNPTGIAISGSGSSTIFLSGTPSAVGPITFTVTPTDAIGTNASTNYTIQIFAPPVLTPNATPSPVAMQNGEVNLTYLTQTITGSGGNGSAVNLTVSNITNNTGLTIGGSGTTSVTVSGTPTASGNVSFTVTPADSLGANPNGAKTYTLTVFSAPSLTPNGVPSPVSMPNAEAGVLYPLQTITASGGNGTITLNVGTTTNTTGLTIGGSGTSAVTVSGTPTSGGTVTFTVTPSDSFGANVLAAKTYTFTVYPPIVLSPSNLALTNAEVGIAYAQQSITGSGGNGTINLALSNINNNTGLTIGGSGTTTITVSGTPTSAGTVSFTATPSDSFGANPGAAKAYTFTVFSAAVPTPSSLPNGEAGISYSQTITPAVNTGSTPVTLGLSNISSVAGLTVVSGTVNSVSTVTISGKPTAAGTVSFTVTPSDAVGTNAAKNYSFTVFSAATPTPGTLLNGEVGIVYSQSIISTGGNGPTTLALSLVSNTTGIAISGDGTSTITLSGKPTSAGTVSFTLTPTDSIGTNAGTLFSFTVFSAAKPIPSTLVNGEAGIAYNASINSMGGNGTVNLAVTNISNSTGITINGTGTPTITLGGTPSTSGTVSFTVTPTDAIGTNAGTTYSFTVFPAAVPSPSSLANGEVGITYNQTVTSTGGNGTVNLTVSTVTNTTGIVIGGSGSTSIVLSGKPSSAGTVTFTVTPTDAIGTNAGKVYSFTVFSAAAPTPLTLPNGEVAIAYGQTLTSTGGTGTVNLAVSAITNTTGILISGSGSNTITLSGTPTSSGTVTFTVTPSDVIGTNTAITYSFTVFDKAVSTPSSLPSGKVGNPYSQTISSTGGSAPVKLTVSNITNTTGIVIGGSGTSAITLSGTPTSASTVIFTVTPSDAVGTSAGTTYTISVTLFNVTVTAPKALAKKDGSLAGSFAISTDVAVFSDLTVNVALTGTAVGGGDYQALSASAVIKAGTTSSTLAVTPIPNSNYTGDKTVVLTLGTGTNYVISNPSAAVVTIAETNTFALSSAPIAVPSPGFTTQTITYTVASNSAGASYVWDFGDGSPKTTDGASTASHVYSTAGIYTVSVTATAPNGATAGPLTVSEAISVLDTTDPLTVGGYPQSLSDILNVPPASPITNAAPFPTLLVTKLSVALNFLKTGKDTVTLTGVVPLGPGFKPDTVIVGVDVGGVVERFRLGSTGKVTKSTGSLITVATKPDSQGNYKFMLTLKNGTYAAQFAKSGLINKTVSGASTPLKVWVSFGGYLYYVVQPQTYSATFGKSGKSQ